MRLARCFAVALACAALPAAAVPAAAQSSQPAATRNADVDAFARAATENSLSEVLLSAMALQKTQDKRVEDYAWTMLDHHARAMGDLAEALSPGAAPLPTEPNAQQQAELRRMRAMSGAEFDRAYFPHQLEAHGRAIQLFEGATRLPDAKVAGYAASTAPVLRAHREIAQFKQSQPADPLPAE